MAAGPSKNNCLRSAYHILAATFASILSQHFKLKHRLSSCKMYDCNAMDLSAIVALYYNKVINLVFSPMSWNHFVFIQMNNLKNFFEIQESGVCVELNNTSKLLKLSKI